MKLKNIVLLVTLLGSLLIPAVAQSPGEKAILQLEDQWQQALLSADTAALERLYGDQMVYVHSNGKVDNKESYITSIRTGAAKYLSLVRDEIKVTLYGDSAIVNCHWKVQTLSNGTTGNTDARFIHVYVRQKGRWRMVAHQSTRIAQ